MRNFNVTIYTQRHFHFAAWLWVNLLGIASISVDIRILIKNMFKIL